MSLFNRLASLARDNSGVSVIEFAIIAPVLLVMLLGVFDLGHNMYTTSMLQGAIQKAARDSTIEGAPSNEDALDAKVENAVLRIAPQAELIFTRTSYASFSDVGTPEDFTDTNANDVCDNGEPFEDANGNGNWDADRGSTGFGGARDAVLYTVRVEYERFFPVAEFVGQSRTMALEVKTVLRNQPYGLQTTQTPEVENCT